MLGSARRSASAQCIQLAARNQTQPYAYPCRVGSQYVTLRARPSIIVAYQAKRQPQPLTTERSVEWGRPHTKPPHPTFLVAPAPLHRDTDIENSTIKSRISHTLSKPCRTPCFISTNGDDGNACSIYNPTDPTHRKQATPTQVKPKAS